ncbi:MAG TPA: hypothetical protein VM493_07875 [Vicinamibacterales bacterium]|nr:hypothetical protein [Vicinamibacterales bacterium]
MSRFTIREMTRVICEQMPDAPTIEATLGPKAKGHLLALVGGEPQRAKDLSSGIRIGLLLAEMEAAAIERIALDLEELK